MTKTKETFLKVYVKPHEKEAIARAAEACCLSMSAFARTLALGHHPTSCADIEKMDEMMEIHANLGRLGGLLKMTLTNDERLNDIGREMGIVTIDATLVDIRTTQAKLLELVDLVAKKAKAGD